MGNRLIHATEFMKLWLENYLHIDFAEKTQRLQLFNTIQKSTAIKATEFNSALEITIKNELKLLLVKVGLVKRSELFCRHCDSLRLFLTVIKQLFCNEEGERVSFSKLRTSMEGKHPQTMRRSASSSEKYGSGAFAPKRKFSNEKRNSKDLTLALHGAALGNNGSEMGKSSSPSSSGDNNNNTNAGNTRSQPMLPRKNSLKRSSGSTTGSGSGSSSSSLTTFGAAAACKLSLSLTEIRSTDLAKAITLVEFDMFEKLNPTEFLQRIKWFPVTPESSMPHSKGSDDNGDINEVDSTSPRKSDKKPENVDTIGRLIDRFNEVKSSCHFFL